MQKWEYKVQRLNWDDELNGLGLDGWELVSVFQLVEFDEDVKEDFEVVVGYFKRPLEN